MKVNLFFPYVFIRCLSQGNSRKETELQVEYCLNSSWGGDRQSLYPSWGGDRKNK